VKPISAYFSAEFSVIDAKNRKLLASIIIKPGLKSINLAKYINRLELRLSRHGYNAKALAELLDTKPAEIRSFLQGNLTPARTQELQNSLLAIGIPL
jgi:O-acetylhomoserine/O-acetylserine sulfhydrylase-like pyridoxal-dependent enzyme